MKKCIGENAKVTQHDPDYENADEGDNEENLKAPHCTLLDANVTNNSSRICQRKNVLEGHTMSRPCSSFSPFDSNCPK